MPAADAVFAYKDGCSETNPDVLSNVVSESIVIATKTLPVGGSMAAAALSVKMQPYCPKEALLNVPVFVSFAMSYEL